MRTTGQLPRPLHMRGNVAVKWSKLIEAMVDSEMDPEVPKSNLTLMYRPNSDIAPSATAPSTRGTDLTDLLSIKRSSLLV